MYLRIARRILPRRLKNDFLVLLNAPLAIYSAGSDRGSVFEEFNCAIYVVTHGDLKMESITVDNIAKKCGSLLVTEWNCSEMASARRVLAF